MQFDHYSFHQTFREYQFSSFKLYIVYSFYVKNTLIFNVLLWRVDHCYNNNPLMLP